jgi:hypothetical protein
VWRGGTQPTWNWAAGARLENAPGGLVDVQRDGTITMSSGAGSFNNRGVWRKSAGSGALTLGGTIGFTNAAVVDVQQGAVVFGAGFTSSGTFAVSNGAAVRLTGGTFRLQPGHVFSGGGYYGVPSGTVSIDGPITEPDFRFDSGNLTLNNQLSGILQWTGGTLAGAWSIASSGVLNVTSNTGAAEPSRPGTGRRARGWRTPRTGWWTCSGTAQSPCPRARARSTTGAHGARAREAER